MAEWAHPFSGWLLKILKRPDESNFVVLPRRWVGKRIFAWLGRHRRLSKDCEVQPETRKAFIYFAMARLMLRRLVHGHG